MLKYSLGKYKHEWCDELRKGKGKDLREQSLQWELVCEIVSSSRTEIPAKDTCPAGAG